MIEETHGASQCTSRTANSLLSNVKGSNPFTLRTCDESGPIRSRPAARAPSAATFVAVPRPPRPCFADAVYHVTSRGNRRAALFHSPDDHRFHLWALNRVALESEWQVMSYVHMTNHFHFLVKTPKPNLSAGMQRLNGLYGQVFNIRNGLSGHVFQGRFHSRLVETDGHRLECARYDDLNPVRAGLCNHPLDWRWSSFRALMGLVPKPDFLSFALLDLFASSIGLARRRYLRFVEDRIDRAAS